MKKGKLFIISAPSGTGKTTLINAFLQRYGHSFDIKRVITYTTRPARIGEVEGKDYHFISPDVFKEMIGKQQFLEWSCWYDYYYGSPIGILDAITRGHSYFLVIDRPGALEASKAYPEAVLIWIEPPSLKELERRLILRDTDTAATIASRIRKAHVEMEQELVERRYHYTIINEDIDESLVQLVGIVSNTLDT